MWPFTRAKPEPKPEAPKSEFHQRVREEATLAFSKAVNDKFEAWTKDIQDAAKEGKFAIWLTDGDGGHTSRVETAAIQRLQTMGFDCDCNQGNLRWFCKWV